MRIRADEHPNITKGREVIPRAVTPEFVRMIRQEYGEGSGVYVRRVLGEFPNEADETSCARSWLELATHRWEERKDHGSGD